MNEYYPFVNEPLPYSYNALEPYIDAETMYFHHNKHLQAYIDKLNEIMEQNPYMQQFSLKQLLSDNSILPPQLKIPIRNNAGGVYNHRMFFDGMCAEQNELSDGVLKAMVLREFGSMERLWEKFKAAALSVFGSGYAWLTYECGRLCILTTPNQNTPLEGGFMPILLVDVWEHAYYLKNQNRREDYLNNYMHVIDWEKVEINLINAKPVFRNNGR